MTDKLDYGQTADFPHFTAAPSGSAPHNFQLARAEAPERADKFLLILALGGAAAETHLSWVVMATAEMTRGCRIFFFLHQSPAGAAVAHSIFVNWISR